MWFPRIDPMMAEKGAEPKAARILVAMIPPILMPGYQPTRASRQMIGESWCPKTERAGLPLANPLTIVR
jgi:hypothetical protein